MKFPDRVNRFLVKVDSFAPTPWIIDGVEQVRPAVQFAFFCGCVVGLILAIILI